MEVARDEVVATLRRAGFGDLAPQVASDLPDPVDLQELLRWGESHGITRERLIERMGGSP